MVRWWLATSFAVCLAHAAHEHHREDALHGHGAHHEGHDEHEAHRHGHGHKAHSHGEVPPAASPSPAGLRSLLSWLTAQPWWVSAYVCAFGMSIISFAGAALMIPLQVRRIAAMVEYSSLTFAATVLVADALVHLLPHALEGADHETMTTVGIAATAGCLAIMSIPELVEWHHGHRHEKKSAEDAEGQEPHVVHAYGIANLVTEMLHNFVDGIGLGMAWRAGASSGCATALAVAVHELPQEIGDFMVLRAAGFPVGQLLGWNFLASLTCLGGVGLVHVLGQTDWAAVVQRYTTAFTAGSFLALALNMVFPQVSQTIHQHHPSAVARFWANLLCLAISVAAIWTLVWIGEFEGGHEHGHGASHGHAHGHEL